MKDFKDIVENSLYTIEKEKKELKNSTITDVFWLNFLFLLYFYKNKINHPKIKKLIKGERVRPDKINDGSAVIILNNITYDTFHIPNSVEFIGDNPEKLYTLFRKLMGWKNK